MTEEVRRTQAAAKWVQGLFLSSAAVAIAESVWRLSAYADWAGINDPNRVEVWDSWQGALAVPMAIQLLQLLFWVTGFIALLTWMYRAYSASLTLYAAERDWDASWTLWGWIVLRTSPRSQRT